MPSPKVSNVEILRLVRKGQNVTTLATELGVSKATISRRLKQLDVAVTKDTALCHAGEIVPKQIQTVEHLQKINDHANEILDLLMRWNRGDDEALQILESQVRYVQVGKEKEPVKEYKHKDPRELALKAMAEIRNQLKLQLEIFQALYDMKAVAEFQREVIEAIGGVAPDVRDRILHNLTKKRAIRSSIEWHP